MSMLAPASAPGISDQNAVVGKPDNANGVSVGSSLTCIVQHTRPAVRSDERLIDIQPGQDRSVIE